MGSTAREIEQHIASERGKLDRDISELQSRVQNATNWRWQVKQRPLAAVGAALAGGFLAAVLSGRNGRRNSSDGENYFAAQRREQPRKSRDVMLGFAMAMGMRRLARLLRS